MLLIILQPALTFPSTCILQPYWEMEVIYFSKTKPIHFTTLSLLVFFQLLIYIIYLVKMILCLLFIVLSHLENWNLIQSFVYILYVLEKYLRGMIWGMPEDSLNKNAASVFPECPLFGDSKFSDLLIYTIPLPVVLFCKANTVTEIGKVLEKLSSCFLPTLSLEKQEIFPTLCQ